MRTNFKIKVVSNTDLLKYADALSDFYFRIYKIRYKKPVLNSTYIVFVEVDNKIVGALRIITDKSRYALIVNFQIEEKMQNNGIGTKVINKAVAVCQKNGVKNIRLFADPTPEKRWVVDFYKKLGFDIYGAIPMEYKTN